MLCDEGYRSWAMTQGTARPPAPELLPGMLTRVSPCPARAGCRELHFDVDGAAWSWCFPLAAEPSAASMPSAKAVVLRPGPHGLMAEALAAQGSTGAGRHWLDLASAADLVLSAVPVYVHQSLLGRAAADPTRSIRKQTVAEYQAGTR